MRISELKPGDLLLLGGDNNSKLSPESRTVLSIVRNPRENSDLWYPFTYVYLYSDGSVNTHHNDDALLSSSLTIIRDGKVIQRGKTNES
jgi:hypothetical protein